MQPKINKIKIKKSFKKLPCSYSPSFSCRDLQSHPHSINTQTSTFRYFPEVLWISLFPQKLSNHHKITYATLVSWASTICLNQGKQLPWRTFYWSHSVRILSRCCLQGPDEGSLDPLPLLTSPFQWKSLLPSLCSHSTLFGSVITHSYS